MSKIIITVLLAVFAGFSVDAALNLTDSSVVSASSKEVVSVSTSDQYEDMMISGNKIQGEYTILQGLTADQEQIWCIQTDTSPCAQIRSFTDMGIHGDTYYYCKSNTVFALDKNTGSVKWMNTDCGHVTSYDFAPDGTIYTCSYIGTPAFAAIDTYGQTIHTINDFGKIYWPFSVEYQEDHVAVTFESTVPNTVLYVDPKDFSYRKQDDSLYVYCIASEYATLRETPSTSARAITTIPSRDAAEYLSEDGVFYYVKYNGMKGYVLKDFFSIDKNANLNHGDGSNYGGTSMTLYCRASEYATLRETPSTSANALTTIPSRGAVEHLGEDGSFYYVKYNGMRGYVLKDFFSFDRNASLNYGDGSSYSTSTMNLYCRASEYATLRETPSTSAYALTTIPSRGVVEYLGVNGSFYYVRYNGMTGYVLQDFFSSDRNASLNYGDGSNYSSSSTTLYCRASEYATLRSYASVDATALAKVYSREAVQYLGDSGDFYYVSYRGAKGYVLKNYFSTNPSAELNYGTN